jgi:hypothetical protein
MSSNPFRYNHKGTQAAMTITIDPKIEAHFRTRADAAGLSVDAYIERLLNADASAASELESLALEGLNSGEPIEAEPGYWEEKHRRPDMVLKRVDSH